VFSLTNSTRSYKKGYPIN